jgi:hypothetical protein
LPLIFDIFASFDTPLFRHYFRHKIRQSAVTPGRCRFRMIADVFSFSSFATPTLFAITLRRERAVFDTFSPLPSLISIFTFIICQPQTHAPCWRRHAAAARTGSKVTRR